MGLRKFGAQVINAFMGKVGIGTDNPTEELEVAGTVKTDEIKTDLIQSSDTSRIIVTSNTFFTNGNYLRFNVGGSINGAMELKALDTFTGRIAASRYTEFYNWGSLYAEFGATIRHEDSTYGNWFNRIATSKISPIGKSSGTPTGNNIEISGGYRLDSTPLSYVVRAGDLILKGGTVEKSDAASSGSVTSGDVYIDGGDIINEGTAQEVCGNVLIAFNSDAMVGINTNSPTQMLHVDSGAILIADNTSLANNGEILIGSQNDDGWSNIIGESSALQGSWFVGVEEEIDSEVGFGTKGADPINLVTNLQSRLSITSDGNVGIGTTSPDTKLDVNGDVTITDKIIHKGDTDTNLEFGNDSIQIQAGNGKQIIIDTDGNNRTRIQNQLHAGNYLDLSTVGNYTLHDGVSSIMKMSQFEETTRVVSGNILAKETAGEDGIGPGELVYKNTSGRWQAASATSVGEVDKMLGIALNTANDGQNLDVLIDGVLNYISGIYEQIATATPGVPLYASTTAGNITETEPSTTGNIVKVIGHNINTYVVGRTNYVLVRFNPDNSWIEL